MAGVVIRFEQESAAARTFWIPDAAIRTSAKAGMRVPQWAYGKSCGTCPRSRRFFEDRI